MIIFADYRRTVANILKSFPRVTKLAEIFAISSPSVFSRRSRHPSSVSREARVGRSGDSSRERRVAVLLATSGVGRAITICREKRRARRQWRELTHADLLFFLENVRFPPHRQIRPQKREIVRGNQTADSGFKNLLKNLPSFLPTGLITDSCGHARPKKIRDEFGPV